MIVDARAHAWAALQLCGVPAPPLADLLRAFGSPEAILAASRAARRSVVAAKYASKIDDGPDPARLAATISWLDADAHMLVAWDDDDYPRAVLEIGGPPPVLYCVGRRDLLRAPAVAIVGSRNATPQGCADAQAFAATLSAAGLTIVSGLALGIDAAAHRGGLAGVGSTIAVIGTGPDRVYPARNRDLAHAIAEGGLIVSEFAPGTPPQKANFPRRNRLVSGLAQGVLVVEATLSSGSLITARLAAEQGREVFALPGSIHSPFSKGCHKLIREGAKLVETAQDILEELKMPGAIATIARGAADADAGPRNDVDAAVLEALGRSPADVDALASRTRIDAATIIATLVTLELDGMVAALPGGLWQRLE